MDTAGWTRPSEHSHELAASSGPGSRASSSGSSSNSGSRGRGTGDGRLRGPSSLSRLDTERSVERAQVVVLVLDGQLVRGEEGE